MNYRGVRKTNIERERRWSPTVKKLWQVYLQWEELRKLPACRKGLKVCSFHRLTQQRPEDRLACSLATRSLFMSMREAFVTLPTEGRLAITFHHRRTPSSLSLKIISVFLTPRCMGGVTYVHMYTCVIIIPKFSNTTSVGKNWKFNQVRGRFTLPPSSFFLLCAPD